MDNAEDLSVEGMRMAALRTFREALRGVKTSTGTMNAARLILQTLGELSKNTVKNDETNFVVVLGDEKL